MRAEAEVDRKLVVRKSELLEQLADTDIFDTEARRLLAVELRAIREEMRRIRIAAPRHRQDSAA